ncbi:MAG: hypothetical protein ACRDT4_23425 [Micromonosporaceae bacterium]
MATAQPEAYREAFQTMFAAASPLAQFGTAYQAERAVSMLLGGVYAKVAGGDRRTEVAGFTDEFVKFLGRRRNTESLAVLGGLATVAPGAAGERATKTLRRFEEHAVVAPRWVAHAGRVSCTGAWQVRDMFGDQTNFLITFEYESQELGGPEHAVCAIIDHNSHTVIDMVVKDPAADVIGHWTTTTEKLVDIATIDPVAPGLARAQIERCLPKTESLREIRGGQQFLDNWALVTARIGVLPDIGDAGPPPALDETARAGVVRGFLASPEAGRVGMEMAQSVPDTMLVLERAARLVVDYAVDANSGDPMRWSPTAVKHLLLEWAPQRRGSIPPEVASWLPEALDAFAMYAGDVRQVPDLAELSIRKAILESSERYSELMLGTPEGESMDQIFDKMLDAGVDPSDDAAARRWLEEYMTSRDQAPRRTEGEG